VSRPHRPVDEPVRCSVEGRRLVDSRKRVVVSFAWIAGMSFVVWLIMALVLPRWFLVLNVVLGVCSLGMAAAPLVRPSVLTLTCDGLVYRSWTGREFAHAWSDCSAFEQVELGLKRLNRSRWGGPLGARLAARLVGQEGVGMTVAGWSSARLREAQPRRTRMSTAVSGVDAALPPGTAGLATDELVAVLNRYRDHHKAVHDVHRVPGGHEGEELPGSEAERLPC
jgi:hypothetical protein